jgi:hypothetical protein
LLHSLPGVHSACNTEQGVAGDGVRRPKHIHSQKDQNAGRSVGDKLILDSNTCSINCTRVQIHVLSTLHVCFGTTTNSASYLLFSIPSISRTSPPASSPSAYSTKPHDGSSTCRVKHRRTTYRARRRRTPPPLRPLSVPRVSFLAFVSNSGGLFLE